MNKELLKKVADHIALYPKNFDFDYYFQGTIGDIKDHACGTTACIAGWTIVIAGKDVPEDDELRDHVALDIARELLGISEQDALSLFMPWSSFWLYRNPSDPSSVVSVLNKLINGELKLSRWGDE